MFDYIPLTCVFCILFSYLAPTVVADTLPQNGNPSTMSALNDGEDKAGLDFYFGRPTDMMRRLETSKFTNRVKTRASPSSADIDESSSALAGSSPSVQLASPTPSSPNPSATNNSNNNNAENDDKVGGYLFKWQRDQKQDNDYFDDDDEADGNFPVQSTEANQAKHRARYQVITGNTNASSLSIAAYFENATNGVIKGGKPIGRDGFVNCGGVALIPFISSSLAMGGQAAGQYKQRLNFSELNEINRYESITDADNLMSLRGDSYAKEDAAEAECLVFRKQGCQWPPEAPGFPPPPPDGNENVQFKRVPLPLTQQQQHGGAPVRRLSRITKQQHDKLSELNTQPSFKNVNRGRTPSTLQRDRAPSAAMVGSPSKMKPIAEKPTGGFFSRMLPSALSKQPQVDSTQFPGVYASFVMVPYILPPPPQPMKHPAPGSNEEKRQQRFCMKKMLLEDQYSTILENVEEKLRLNEVVHEMERQIMDSDEQINQLIGQSDAADSSARAEAQ